MLKKKKKKKYLVKAVRYLSCDYIVSDFIWLVTDPHSPAGHIGETICHVVHRLGEGLLGGNLWAPVEAFSLQLSGILWKLQSEFLLSLASIWEHSPADSLMAALWDLWAGNSGKLCWEILNNRNWDNEWVLF